jgi:RES domain-containing protein
LAHDINHYPDFDHLLRRIQKVKMSAYSLRAVVFRSSEPTYATEIDLLNGQGSRETGGRWNPPYSFATVYASFSDVTALAEAKANHLYFGLDPADALPRTIVSIDVRLSSILDLTDGIVRKSLRVSATRMRSDDWRAAKRRRHESLTQAIGRAGYDIGVEGLVVPACDNARNLVWFPGNLRAGSKVVIRNVSKLG